MSRKHMLGSVDRRGQKNAAFATLMNHNEASLLFFSTISRSGDFCVLTTTDKTDLYMRAG